MKFTLLPYNRRVRPENRNALMLFGASVAFQALFITLDAFASDEGIVLVASDDIAKGRLLYRDINVPLTPAVYLLQGLAFKLFGSSFLVSRALICITNAIGVVLVFSVARCFLSLGRATVAGALAIPLQIWMWPHAQYFSYNTVAIVLALLAIRLAWSIEVEPDRRRSAFLLGVAFAAGLWTKPNIPLAIGLGLLLYWLSGWLRTSLDWPRERSRGFADLWREGWAVLAGMAIASLPMVGYLAAVGILDDVINNIIAISQIYDDSPSGLFPTLFPLTEQIDSVRTNPSLILPGMLVNGKWGLANHRGYQYLSDHTGLIDLFIRLVYYLPIAIFLLVFAILIYRLIRRTWSPMDEAAWLAFITALSLYLTNMSFPALHYVTPTLLPLIALATFLIFRMHDSSSGIFRILIKCVGTATVAIYLAASAAALSTYLRVPRTPIQTARGTIWIEQATAKIWTEIIAYTQLNITDEDRICVVPYFPLFYFLTDREHPTRFVALGPGLPGRPAENEIIEQLERDAVEFVLYTPGQEYPGLEEFKNAYPRLDGYIQRNFELEREFHGPFGVYAQLMRRYSAEESQPQHAMTRVPPR